MKKTLLLLTASCFSLAAFAQKPVIVGLPTAKFDGKSVKAATMTLNYNTDKTIPFAKVPIVSNRNERGTAPKLRDGEFLLGTTTYDLFQSNQLLSNGPDGKLSAVWTGSDWVGDLYDTTITVFPDRGTYYRYYDGTNWGPEPTVRVEPIYTGFPGCVFTGHGGEFLTSNNSKHNIGCSSDRPSAGSGSWSFQDSLDARVIWPRVVSWGNTVHLIGSRSADEGKNFVQYSRSSDGGVTWDIVNKQMPGIDTSCVKFMFGSSYAMDVRGNTVAIVGGGVTSSVYLWKSTDGGNTFDTTKIWDFPICNFDGKTLTDADGDGIADTISTSDGDYAVIIDNNNNVHAFMGFTNITDDDTASASFTYFYGPGTSGILHWSEANRDSLIFVGNLVDVDDDGTLGIGRDWPIYNFGSQCSMPSVSIDTTANIIYCVFSSAVENTDVYGDPTDPSAQSYRDLYGIYSTDNGATWSKQVNLTNSAVLNKENVNPSVARYTVNGQVNVMWMQDGDPGIAFDDSQEIPDPVHFNDIMFKHFKLYDFTGVKAISAPVVKELTIYPNPSNGLFSISAEGLQSEKAKITVTNILGQNVKTFEGVTAKSNMYMNLSSVPSGIYFVKIETAQQTFTGKVNISK